jgi:hypothetical protein
VSEAEKKTNGEQAEGKIYVNFGGDVGPPLNLPTEGQWVIQATMSNFLGIGLVPTAIVLDEEKAACFDMLSATCGGEDLLDRSALALERRRGVARVDLRVVDPPRSNVVDVWVKNRTPSPASFNARLLCSVSKNVVVDEDDTSVHGLLDRCRRWFRDGLAAALEDRKVGIASRELDELVKNANGTNRPVRPTILVIDNFRFLFAAVAGFASIPFLAAVKGWNDLMEMQDRLRTPALAKRNATIGFGPKNIAPSAQANIKVVPQLAFRPLSLRLDSTSARHFDVEDVRVGKNSQFPVAGSIPGILFNSIDGLPVGLDAAAPGQVISIHVRNTSGGHAVFQAALVGEVDA